MSLRTLKLCKTCEQGEKDGKGYFCLLRCASCSVPENSMYDLCVNYKNKVISLLLNRGGSFTGKGG